ncbi:MAG: hypothetical protein JKX97_02390 [Candidatus Lindowbacteria bacterium]|nr:hypothetical protein [Candidatus Lindowbacteria bacterium]
MMMELFMMRGIIEENDSTLGLVLVQALAIRQLGGAIEMDHENGTAVIVRSIPKILKEKITA